MLEHHQSNHEGDLVDAIHGARGRAAAIVINAGALTHYAWSLHDALAAFDGPVVELHLSNPGGREPWRATSVITPGGHRHHQRVRRARLPAGHAMPWPHLLGGVAPARRLTVRVAQAVGSTLGPRAAAMDVAARLDRLRGALAALDARPTACWSPA